MMLYNQLKHDLIEVGAMISAIAEGEADDAVLRFLFLIVTPIDMKAGGVEMSHASSQSQARR